MAAECPSCGRALGAAAVRCVYCGRAWVARTEPPPKPRPIVFACPGCQRKVRALANEPASCAFCTLELVAPPAPNRDASFALGPDEVAEDVRAVSRLLDGAPDTALWDLVRAIFAARQERGELRRGEVEEVRDSLLTITRSPVRARWLPLPAEAAETLAPRVVFGVASAGIYRDTDRTTLLVPLGAEARVSMAETALDVLQLAADLSGRNSALGALLPRQQKDEVAGETRVQIRLDLVRAGDGTSLVDIRNQIDQRPPTRLHSSQETELDARVGGAPRLLVGYYLLGALFGRSCRGGTAFSLAREATTTRLRALGCSTTRELEDALSLRMPPPFEA